MYVCMYVCMYIYIYTHTHAYRCRLLCACLDPIMPVCNFMEKRVKIHIMTPVHRQFPTML